MAMIDELPQDHTARSTSTGRAPLIVGLVYAACVLTIGCGETRVDELAGELESVNAKTRYQAAKSLDELGDEAVGAVGALTRALDDESAKIRYRAAKTLAKIGPRAAPAVNALAARLQDDDANVRYYAAKALKEIGPQSAPAVEALTAAIKDEDPKVRYYAVRAIRSIGAEAESAIPALRKAIKDKDVVMPLRIQLERQKDKFLPSLREYAIKFGITKTTLQSADKDVIIMHPGPTNRGLEISAEVADGEYSVILEQVTNGIAIRMAILYLLLGTKEPVGNTED